MSTEPANAPPGDDLALPGETIATEMPSLPNSDPPAPAPDEPEEVAAVAEETETPAERADDETPKPEKQPLDWREKRRIEETNKRRAAEAEATRLRAELEALKKRPAEAPAADTDLRTADDIRREAVEQAKRELAQQAQAEEFEKATGRVLSAGLAEYPDFDAKRQEMIAYFGDQLSARPDFFEAIVDLENGHDVFYALAADPEQAEQILSLPPVKMALRIAQLGNKVVKAPKEPAPEIKSISKAPAPVKPVGGTPQAPSRLDDENLPMEEWSKTFLKQMAGRGR